ncbi:hypothetical protein BN163_1140027 [Clostridioides difficile T5]|nr:hypothetical protein BN163_1140027 [Clostridioides difficile T5]
MDDGTSSQKKTEE